MRYDEWSRIRPIGAQKREDLNSVLNITARTVDKFCAELGKKDVHTAERVSGHLSRYPGSEMYKEKGSGLNDLLRKRRVDIKSFLDRPSGVMERLFGRIIHIVGLGVGYPLAHNMGGEMTEWEADGIHQAGRDVTRTERAFVMSENWSNDAIEIVAGGSIESVVRGKNVSDLEVEVFWPYYHPWRTSPKYASKDWIKSVYERYLRRVKEDVPAMKIKSEGDLHLARMRCHRVYQDHKWFDYLEENQAIWVAGLRLTKDVGLGDLEMSCGRHYRTYKDIPKPLAELPLQSFHKNQLLRRSEVLAQYGFDTRR